MVAKAGSQMILGSAFVTIESQLATGHGHERAIVAFDDFKVADDEAIIKRNAAESAKAVF